MSDTIHGVRFIEVPGGWIYFGGPLSHPVPVSDPAYWAPDETARLNLVRLLSTLNDKVDTIMATLADIQTAETEQATAITGVLDEITQLKAALAAAQAAGADPATIQAIVDEIHTNTAKLTGALPPPSTTPPTTGGTTIGGAGAGGDTITGATDTTTGATG